MIDIIFSGGNDNYKISVKIRYYIHIHILYYESFN